MLAASYIVETGDKKYNNMVNVIKMFKVKNDSIEILNFVVHSKEKKWAGSSYRLGNVAKS